MVPLTDDERLLVEFVIWQMRTGDLPEDVRAAALRLSKTGRHRRSHAGLIRYTEGPLLVDGIPVEDEPLTRRKCFPHQVGRVIGELLGDGCRYVLVQDL